MQRPYTTPSVPMLMQALPPCLLLLAPMPCQFCCWCCAVCVWPCDLSHNNRHVRRCHNIDDVSRLGEGPKVVLATGLSLQQGLSRQLLINWGADSRNAVIFTQPPPVSSSG